MEDLKITNAIYNEDDNTVYVNVIKTSTLNSVKFTTILKNESMDTAENFIKNELKRKSTSVKIDNDSNIGHGHTLSVKIVMPCYCQANCPFCFNKQTSETQVHNFGVFYDNLNLSLDLLFNNISNRKISLDITGNEPIFKQMKRKTRQFCSLHGWNEGKIRNIIETDTWLYYWPFFNED